MDLLNKMLNTLLKENDDYRTPNTEGKKVTNKNHIVFNIIVNDIPSLIANQLKKRNMYNFEYLNIKGSTGDGLLGESYWIALLDERLTKSTTNGIYIALLFDNTLEHCYLTIAFGTENSSLSSINLISTERRKFFSKQLINNIDLKKFEVSNINLGNTNRAKKFAASVSVKK